MALSVGDAVLTFLADSTQLDQAFARIPDQADAAMSAAADSVDQVGDSLKGVQFELDATGSNAAYAGGMIKEGMEGARGSVKEMSYSVHEAAGEAGLLGEMFGIHLPRHVRTFVAEIPAVGTVLSAAFAATAVLFLLEALTQGVEKLQEWAERSQKLAEAWDKYNQTIYTASTGMKKEIDELQRRFIEMTEGPVAGLDFALKHLGTTAFETFAHIEKGVADAVKAMQESSSSLAGIQFNVFKDASKDLEKFKTDLQRVMREAAESHPGDPFAAYNAGIDAVRQKERDLTALINQRTAASGADSSAAVNGLHAERQAINDILPLLQQGIELEKEKAKVLRQSRNDEAATHDAAQAKRDLDAQIANIESWKSAQHAAYEAGQTDLATWLAAEVRATDAAAIAREDYLRRVIAIYKQAGEVEKQNSAEQELLTLQIKDAAAATEALAAGEQKHQEATRKTLAAYAALIDANVAKNFEATAKAAQQLTSAEEDLQKAQSKLAEDKLSQIYKDQEAAITRLAQMHLITEEQKDDRLKLLEQQQANQAIAILNDQLAKEQAMVQAAAARIAAMKLSPGVSPAEILEAEATLKKLEAAATNTEAQLIEMQEKFNKQSEQDENAHQSRMLGQRGKYYEQALLETKAFGEQALAEQLKQNEAALIAADNELKQAKARGANTDAIHKEIDALQANEKALEKEANGGRVTQAEKLKNVQTALAAAQAVLAEAKAHGADTMAMEQNVRQLQRLESATQQVTVGDKALLAQMLLLNKAELLAAQQKLQLAKDQGLDTTAIEQNIKALKQQQVALRQEVEEQDKVNSAMVEMKTAVQQAATTMMNSLSQAMAAVIKGQESFGAAMEKATLQMLGQMAQHWAQYYLALAIGNMWTDPAAAAEEFAAAAALEVIAGAMSGLSGGSSSGSGPAAQQGPTVGTTTTSSAGGGSSSTGSVTKLAEGGIVTKPTMIEPNVMAGDSPTGGAAEEAILPLSDPTAMRQIAKAISPQGMPQSTPQEESGFDPSVLQHMIETIAALTGAKPRDFTFAKSDNAEKPGFSSGEASESDKREFTSGTPSSSGTHQFDWGESATSMTVGEFLGFGSWGPPPEETRKPNFPPERESPSAGDKSGFLFAQASPTPREATGFTSGEPAPGERPAFSAGVPSESEKADFLASQPTVSQAPGFERGTPTVGEAAGFKFDTPYPGDKPVFSSGQPSAPEKPGFSLFAPSASEQRDFIAASAKTIGNLLGFNFSVPRTSYEGLGFTSAPGSTSAKPGFSLGVQSPSEPPTFDAGVPSPGERPAFSFTAPSLPREMPDMESLAANFGGLLSQPTLRAASQARIPAAAVAAGSAAQPIDIEARMERFANRIAAQTQPDSAAAASNDTHIHVNVKGMVSPDNLNKVVKKINRAVQNRQTTLKASDSLRVTRRSQ